MKGETALCSPFEKVTSSSWTGGGYQSRERRSGEWVTVVAQQLAEGTTRDGGCKGLVIRVPGCQVRFRWSFVIVLAAIGLLTGGYDMIRPTES